MHHFEDENVPVSSDIEQKPFLEEAKILVVAVRKAFADLLAEIGADPGQPQEIARRIGIDKSLSWKIARVVREENAWSVLPYLPGKAGIRIFLNSAKKLGAAKDTVSGVNDAVARFDDFVQTHSGDRETFAMMVGSQAEQALPEISEMHRKLAYRGQSATWGVRAQLQLSVQIIAPSAEPGMVDAATVSGFVGFRRLRPDVAWSVAWISNYVGDGERVDNGNGQPIDPRATAAGAPLLLDYCSSPLPSLRVVKLGDLSRKVELAEGPVGLTGAATCLAGWYHRRAATMYKSETDQLAELITSLSTPVEVAIQDVYIHKSFAASMPPTISIYSNLPAGQAFSPAARDKGLLPVGERLIRLGNHPSNVVVPEFAPYGQMVGDVFGKMGWREDEFSGFRLRIAFPPVPSIALFRFPLLDRPTN